MSTQFTKDTKITNAYVNHVCKKSFSPARVLKKHIHIVHEGHKDHKCENCGKSFSEGQLKIHIHTVHEGHKDYKMCNL